MYILTVFLSALAGFTLFYVGVKGISMILQSFDEDDFQKYIIGIIVALFGFGVLICVALDMELGW